MQVYAGPPQDCVAWFNGQLGFAYFPEQDGTVADWVISLVSLRFPNKASIKSKRYWHDAWIMPGALIPGAKIDHHDQGHEFGCMWHDVQTLVCCGTNL